MYQYITTLLLGIVIGTIGGYLSKACPVQTDPLPIITEVETIRYIEKPVIERVTNHVKEIVETPYYVERECIDASSLQYLNDAIRDTAAGREHVGVRTFGRD